MLLDTHIYLWLLLTPEKLTAREQRAMDGAPLLHVSTVSLWEIATLHRLGRIEAPLEELVRVPLPLLELSVTATHCLEYASLPLHHRDPFDRMLLAQARVERVPLLTRDESFRAYELKGRQTVLYAG